MKEALIERFTRYVKIDTQSDETNESTPSTPGQLELANVLVDELIKIGMSDVSIDDNGYVMATLPANTDKELPTIGFLAHVDTATDFTGKNVNPQIVENFSGDDLTLNPDKGIILSANDFPELPGYAGHTLITTDGTTLLGADDKAGIAEIMTAMAYLINHPEIQHGNIRIAFTPDEEIGRGPHKFDVDRFDADFAYTMDGGPLGELQYESFNAAAAKITFHGNNVHPGTAKNKMVNAGKLAAEFINKVPEHEVPEHTEQYEGFYHLLEVTGDVEQATISYIIRDFDKDNFAARKETIRQFIKEMNAKYGEGSAEITMNDQYYNMREKIEPVKEIVDVAYQAMENIDIKPLVKPVRGGTDGSQLSYMGLPTPNIFTGGENYHGKYEYISVDNMEKATNVIIEICRLYAAKA
ncbi:peptidase T. Metallo peptidase. MEROPS family M20B [Lentibacillus persicus]|uniref:Peptidase T n=1 Tax=Lentibacillus persicus TaxID=640948 RepID=A0A1I1Y7Z0_9BACI|nr:peptidase T [Lentibacillus persicus]SFE15697.1 peptidase T. Metallo peptidase. MEROPS family M20B [Lentibacillus persicus]